MDTKYGPTGADVLAQLMDKALPERMKLTDFEWFDAMLDAESMTKRQLLKELRASWDNVLSSRPGYQRGSVRRGIHLPDAQAVKRLCSQLIEYCSNLPLSDEPPSQEEADEYSDIIMPFVAAFADVNSKGAK